MADYSAVNDEHTGRFIGKRGTNVRQVVRLYTYHLQHLKCRLRRALDLLDEVEIVPHQLIKATLVDANTHDAQVGAQI